MPVTFGVGRVFVSVSADGVADLVGGMLGRAIHAGQGCRIKGIVGGLRVQLAFRWMARPYAHLVVPRHNERPDARAQYVLRRHDATRGNLGELIGSDRLQCLGGVIEVKDAGPAAARHLAPDHREDRRGEFASRSVVQAGRRWCHEGALALQLLRHEGLRLLDYSAEVVVAFAGSLSPDGEAVLLHHQRDRVRRRSLGIPFRQAFRQGKTGPHVLQERHLVPEDVSQVLLGLRRVGQRESRHVVGVRHEASGQQRVQRRLDARHGIAVGEEHAGAHERHHLFVGERVSLTEQGQPVEVEVSETGRTNRSQIGAAALDDERWHLAAEEVCLGELDGCVPATRLHQRGIAADEIREVNELVDVCLVGVSFVPGLHEYALSFRAGVLVSVRPELVEGLRICSAGVSLFRF